MYKSEINTDDPITKNITPVILAGGFGTRLRSVISDRPKVLAPVKGKPFLSILLDQLIGFGFDRVILCIGYRAEQIIQSFGMQYKSLSIDYSIESKPLGTGGAILPAIKHVKTKYLLISNGDSFVPFNLFSFYSFLRDKSAEGAIIVSYRDSSYSLGHVQIGKNRKIIRFAEKKEIGNGWVNTGVYLISADWFTGYKSGKYYSIEHDFFPTWTRKSFFAHPISSSFIDIGTPGSYRSSETFFSTPSSRGRI
ncbi:MAG: sugar phosphate nucleotidyltransferase [Fidelibacterota bacterium]